MVRQQAARRTAQASNLSPKPSRTFTLAMIVPPTWSLRPPPSRCSVHFSMSRVAWYQGCGCMVDPMSLRALSVSENGPVAPGIYSRIADKGPLCSCLGILCIPTRQIHFLCSSCRPHGGKVQSCYLGLRLGGNPVYLSCGQSSVYNSIHTN